MASDCDRGQRWPVDEYAGDEVLDVSGAEVLHRALPCSRLVTMRGIGHIPMIEAARQTAADYRAFRASLPKSTATVRRAS